MSGVASVQNLLIVLCFLIGVKFGVVPLVAWQERQIESISVKRLQLFKLESLVEHRDGYLSAVRELDESLLLAKERSWVSESSTQLDLHKRIERIFDRHNVVMESFSWVFDGGSELRELRAAVRLEGESVGVIEALLEMSVSAKVIKQVAWNYRLKNNGKDSLGRISGDVTLEFYAMPE